jgi:F0F1-type ATP synthase membrane subunit b/b'
VSAILEYRTQVGAALAALLLLGACSDRDTKLAESMGAAEQSAMRAEKAAERAEEAANRAGAAAAPVVVEEEEEATDEADKAIAEANEPPVNEPDGSN